MKKQEYFPRLLKYYKEKIIPEMKKEFNLKNDYEVTVLKKVVVNMGVSASKEDIKFLDEAMFQLANITGQRPVIRRAKKSISNFHLRKGMPIGCMVTLRRWKMYEFVDRLVNISIPRLRDFRGLSYKSIDKSGNYTFGISDITIFPEINMDKISRQYGLSITFVLKRGDIKQKKRFLELLGIPFRKMKDGKKV